MNSAILECRRLTKTFRGFQLGPMNAVFPAGKVTGVFGPNGAGKSTLISALTGLLEKDSGEIISNHQVAYGGVFEQSFLLPHTRVVDQIEALRVALGRSNDVRDAVVNECGLQPYLNRRVAKLSTGNKQRLALALALIQDPDVYILDEPLNGLDPDGIEWFNNKVKVIASEQKVVIFATHLLAEAEMTVDRCLFLQDGHVIYEGDIEDIVASIEHPDRYVCLETSGVEDDCQGLDIVYRDTNRVYLYEPAGRSRTIRGLSLKELAEKAAGRIPLAVLYRLKTHDFRESGGFSQ